MGSTYFSKRYRPDTSRYRRRRPKTFRSPEHARQWAEKNKLENFEVMHTTYSTPARTKYVVKA